MPSWQHGQVLGGWYSHSAHSKQRKGATLDRISEALVLKGRPHQDQQDSLLPVHAYAGEPFVTTGFANWRSSTKSSSETEVQFLQFDNVWNATRFSWRSYVASPLIFDSACCPPSESCDLHTWLALEKGSPAAAPRALALFLLPLMLRSLLRSVQGSCSSLRSKEANTLHPGK
jgi:hypothetical protein